MSNTKTEAQRLGDWLDGFHKASVHHECAAELRRLENALMQAEAERDQLRAQLAKAVAEEREACAELMEQQHTWITNIAASAAIRARSNT